MLTHLHIRDFTLVSQLDLELQRGLTAITGETGAGKSIMLDALGLTLGDRADADKVRSGCSKADIHASFDISQLGFAQNWLVKNELSQGDECILRRVITKDGRSRAYINGHTVTLQQLRELGEKLIDIHNQHEHQSLLKTTTHRRLLDESAGLQELAQSVRLAYAGWHQVSERLGKLRQQSDELNARYQLLHYQVSELAQLDLHSGEVEQLEQEQQALANMEEVLHGSQHVVDLCQADEGGIQQQLRQAVQLLARLPAKSAALRNAEELLGNAAISVEEACADVERHLDGSEQNPARLEEVEQRLSAIYDIARKHRIPPEQLVNLHRELADELEQLQSGDLQAEQLEALQGERLAAYQALADKLSAKRRKAATALAKAVNQQLQALAMASAELSVLLTPRDDGPNLYGDQKIEFLISTNPGQAPKPLHKVASGGELSRISLAIQVVTAHTSTTPTLVFDEVDVGIGGTTGDVVGRMLRELGGCGQIFCVTHLAQVASKAHQHYRVEKIVHKDSASSSLAVLEGEEKILEIARMMGGAVTSEQSLAHAREMVESS